MKRIIIVFGILFFSHTTCHSQILISLLFGDKLNSDKIEFGLEGGLNFATISNLNESSNYLPLLNLGMYFDFYLEKNLYLHTGVLVKSTMGVGGLNPYPLGDNELDSVLSSGTVIRKIQYFNVPVLLRYRFFDFTHFEMGINMGLRHKATDEFQVDFYDKDDLVFKNDVRSDYRRLDAGLMAGMGYKLIQGTGANLGVRYYFGLVNILKENPGKAQRNSSIYLYAGIPIGAGKKKQKDEN